MSRPSRRGIHVVMPMAGRGSRFLQQGNKDPRFLLPKPLIPVMGRDPMFMHALRGFTERDLGLPVRYTFVITEDHDERYGLGEKIRDVLPGASIIATNTEPQGPLIDARRGMQNVDPSEAVIITYNDIEMHSERYAQTVRTLTLEQASVDGALLLFKSQEEFGAKKLRYGYAELAARNEDGVGTVTEIAEKRMITPGSLAIAGGHYVRDVDTFETAYQAVTDDESMGIGTEAHPEYFVTDIYNWMVSKQAQAAGRVVLGVSLESTGSFWHLGTPEELYAYEAAHAA